MVDGLPNDGFQEPVNERCDWVGLEIALALAAIFCAFGEMAGWEITGLEDLLTDEPAVRELIVPA